MAAFFAAPQIEVGRAADGALLLTSRRARAIGQALPDRELTADRPLPGHGAGAVGDVAAGPRVFEPFGAGIGYARPAPL
jgi:hypothetical protein